MARRVRRSSWPRRPAPGCATWTATSTSTSASATPARWPGTARAGGAGGRRADRARRHDACCRAPTRSRSVRRWLAGSGCRSGSSRSPPPTRTASCCAGPAGSRTARRSSCTTGATTARSTRRSRSSTPDGSVIAAPRQHRPRRSNRRSRRRSSRSTTSPALEAALAPGDVAARAVEPALTNIGIVLPDPGYHDALRELTRRARHAARHRRDAHDLLPVRAATPRPTASSPTS